MHKMRYSFNLKSIMHGVYINENIPGSNWIREEGLMRKSFPAVAVSSFTYDKET